MSFNSVAIFFLLILSLAFPVFPGETAWPTDASTVITSSFGEYRLNHIHAGVDIKTWGHSGYKALAIDSGSVVLISVTPYGYGKRVHFRTSHDLVAVYAHLSRFAPSIEKAVQEEQKRRGRFAVDVVLPAGKLIFRKNELIGYTGSTGASSPHLHFEIRDPENNFINPLSLYEVQDTQKPVLRSLSLTPLCYGSHVEGGFEPRVFHLRPVSKGKYRIAQPLVCWGNVGLALSSFDMANGSPNRFAVYRVQLFVDGIPVLTAGYDRFSIQQYRDIDMERDCRMIRRGLGLFQKLYKEDGNRLTFYNPGLLSAGEIRSAEEYLSGNPPEGPIYLKKGDHALRILASDYSGNTAEADGVLRMMPLSEAAGRIVFPGNGWTGGIPGKIRIPRITLEKRFLEGTVTFRIRFDAPVSELPRVSIRLNGVLSAMVPIVPKSTREFIGQMPLDPSVQGILVTEVRFLPELGWEQLKADTVQLFAITPESGGTMVSTDGNCRIVFPPGSVFKPVWGWIQTETDSKNASLGLGKTYSVVPNDFPLKSDIQAVLNTSSMNCSPNQIAVFAKQFGTAVYLGSDRKGALVSAWMKRLCPVTALADTAPPVLYSVRPVAGARLIEKIPKAVIRFSDRLSGVYGEDNYSVQLDSTRLIMEYDPLRCTASSILNESVAPGRHTLSVTVRDRVGNTTTASRTFFTGSR